MQLKKRAVGAVGRVEKYAAAIPPTNTIKANGAELSRVLFWRLWKHAQESGNLVDQASKDKGHFGTGDGSTTFTIPDHRGVGSRGFDDGAGLDSAPTLGRYQGDNNKSHSHSASSNTTGNHNHTFSITTQYHSGGSTPDSGGAAGSKSTVTTSTAGNHSHIITVDADGSTEATMKNVSFLYCIRYQ
ncbi:hypothetical protein V6238_00245 [Marinomonas arenicola]|uniref:hypothetical protein n=1 Tax=Marinomonas arenicola TaxID=569601 RepID=UPI00311EDC39